MLYRGMKNKNRTELREKIPLFNFPYVLDLITIMSKAMSCVHCKLTTISYVPGRI